MSVQEEIVRRASRDANASVYALDNTYLTRWQKFVVESWFQFPVSFFQIALLGLLALTMRKHLELGEAIGLAYAIGVAVALVNWAVIWKPFIVVSSVFSGVGGMVIHAAFALYFALEREWVYCVVAIATGVGLLAFLAPSIFLYAILNREPMHPKYAFAKKVFGLHFPFEDS